MTRLCCFLLVVIYGSIVSCNRKKQNIEPLPESKIDTVRKPVSNSVPLKEDFISFLGDFSINNDIQKSRIADGAVDLVVRSKTDSTTIKINKATWKFVEIVKNNSLDYIYNNTSTNSEGSNEKVFSTETVAKHNIACYFFKNIRSKWMLIKRVVYLNTIGEHDEFDDFFIRFSNNVANQRSAIDANALDCTVPEGDSTCVKINKSRWTYTKFIGDNTLNHIYNNFNFKIDKADERIYATQIIEDAGTVFYYFKKIDGKWFLVKSESYIDY